MANTRLALTKNVNNLVKKLFRSSHWEDAGQGWEGLEGTLTLSGWSRARGVVVLRRKLTDKNEDQGELAFIENDPPPRATSTPCWSRQHHTRSSPLPVPSRNLCSLRWGRRSYWRLRLRVNCRF